MNNIHPTAIIDPNVKLGKNNTILPYTVIYGPTEIGDDNIIGPHAVIGTPGQDTGDRYYDASNAFIRIGSRNIIREFCAIQKPCYEEITEIGNDVFLMQSVHVPHDCIISDKVVITPMCVLAGLTRVMEGANLGMGCTVNQRAAIGQYSIVATGAVAMKNLKPFSRLIPQKPLTVNYFAIKKFGFEAHTAEIENYVLNDVRPETPAIAEMVEAFERNVAKYNLGNY